MITDPFGTTALRKAALDTWRSSPTRFREDANAEEDLVLGGYRDRWFVELAQNAADAASRASRPGTMRVSIVDNEVRVANTGEPLSPAGVTALASLRASVKRGDGSVGRFGVGFAAVLPVSDEPRVVSTTGGVRFSAAATREQLAAEPILRDELAHRGGQVPVLRLVWPTDEPGPPDGFDTEVRLPLPADADAAELLAQAGDQAGDLLLAFSTLSRIELPGRVWTREQLGDGLVLLCDGETATRWRLARRHGELSDELRVAAEEHHRPEWTVCWAVIVSDDGAPQPSGVDVLHGPTPTDERLSLPARLLATLPVEPSRRRIRAGAAADFVLGQAVRCYPDLVTSVPPTHRTRLVPLAGFPLSEVDSMLREGIVAALRTASWLPGAAGGEVAPGNARVLDTASRPLTELLAELVPGLLAAELSEPAHAAALVALEVPRLALADVVAAVSGVDRPPQWWRRLYDALAALADVGPAARDELAALPVPLADGRTVTGPRSTIVAEQPVGLPWLRVVHPDAVHPLLIRLGARSAGPRALLESPALREAVERSLDDADAGLDTTALAGSVLRLVESVHAAPSWLGALALPAADGAHRRADELVLPDGALRDVIAADSPLGVLHDDVASAHPRAALRAVGVLDGFAVIEDEHPTGPYHELADEEQWWADLDRQPDRLIAVRDLDLVDDGAWSRALRLLAADPATRGALHAEPSYTGWWLARFARLVGRAPRCWRLPSAIGLAGLYDPVPAGEYTELGEELLAAAGVRGRLAVGDADDAADLLARLADPARRIVPATVMAAHAALAAAVVERRLDLDDVDPPPRVRALTGAVTPADDAMVLDRQCLAGITPAGGLVVGGDPTALAELLDLPLASERLAARVVSTGREVAWAQLPEVAVACQALRRPVPPGALILHDTLRVRTAGGADHTVPYWVDDATATVHAADPLRALIGMDADPGISS